MAYDAEIARLEADVDRLIVERDSWRNALTGLTPGGSEYATPDACVAAVRERFDGLHARTVDSHRERDRLRAEVAELVEATRAIELNVDGLYGLTHKDRTANALAAIKKHCRAVLAKHQPKEPQS